MKREHDFSRAKRGAIVPSTRGKTRITIRIDDDVLDWFRARVHKEGGGNYQTPINNALREHITRNEDRLAETLRRVIREEIAPYVAKPKRRSEK
jgi:BrnA antitoxin of type II toxin-antitoxin system